MTELEEKIYNGEHLTRAKLENAIYECDVIDTEYGENGRWTRPASSIIKIKDKLFYIDWEEGLIECQINFFDNQPYEVEEVEETIVVKKYIPKVNNEGNTNG